MPRWDSASTGSGRAGAGKCHGGRVAARRCLRESGAWAWIVLPGWEDAMKQRSQETTPLWVWFSLGLLVIAIIAYAVGYLMFEEINAY